MDKAPMNKHHARVLKRKRVISWLLIAGVWLISSFASQPALAQSIGMANNPFPDTQTGIGVFLDQQTDDPSSARANWFCTHCVGTQKTITSLSQGYKAINPHFIILEYYLGQFSDPIATVPIGNTWTTDYSYVNQQSSWFMLVNGQRCIHTDQDGDQLMNILYYTNGQPVTGFPAYWCQQMVQRARQNFNDGVFADTYTQDTLIFQLNPTPPELAGVSQCQTEWIPSLNLDWQFRESYLHSQPEVFAFLPNFGGWITGWDTTDYTIPDGGMNEGFCFNGSGSYFALSDWQLQMNHHLQLASLGRIIIDQDYPNPGASTFNDDVWFAVGSHLLTKGHHSYLNVDSSGIDWYPQYNAAYLLGAYSIEPSFSGGLNPPGAVQNLYMGTWGVYRRDFQNGFVLVNPSGSPVTINDLGGTFYLAIAQGGGNVPSNGVPTGTLSFQQVSSVTIPAYSARIFIYNPSFQPPPPNSPSPSPPPPEPPPGKHELPGHGFRPGHEKFFFGNHGFNGHKFKTPIFKERGFGSKERGTLPHH